MGLYDETPNESVPSIGAGAASSRRVSLSRMKPTSSPPPRGKSLKKEPADDVISSDDEAAERAAEHYLTQDSLPADSLHAVDRDAALVLGSLVEVEESLPLPSPTPTVR